MARMIQPTWQKQTIKHNLQARAREHAGILDEHAEHLQFLDSRIEELQGVIFHLAADLRALTGVIGTTAPDGAAFIAALRAAKAIYIEGVTAERMRGLASEDPVGWLWRSIGQAAHLNCALAERHATVWGEIAEVVAGPQGATNGSALHG